MSASGSGAGFRSTRWSLVLAAGSDDASTARAAWSELCERYWPPLYAHLRRQGLARDDAMDTVQGFFARLLEKQDLAAAPGRTRFRSYLLGALRNFAANERRAANAEKRGGGVTFTGLDAIDAIDAGLAREPATNATPESLFARRWAVAAIQAALQRLDRDYAARGQAELFARLRPFLDGGDDATSQHGAATALDMTAGAFKVAVHRARQRFQQALRDEVATTLADPADLEDELAALRQAFAP